MNLSAPTFLSCYSVVEISCYEGDSRLKTQKLNCLVYLKYFVSGIRCSFLDPDVFANIEWKSPLPSFSDIQAEPF